MGIHKWVPFLAGTGDLSVLRNIQTGSGIHPASCSVGTGGFPTGVKLPMSAVKWSSSSAKVKNEWSFTTSPSVCLHGVDRNNCSFFM